MDFPVTLSIFVSRSGKTFYGYAFKISMVMTVFYCVHFFYWKCYISLC